MENSLFTQATTTETGLKRLDCTAALTQYSDDTARHLLAAVNSNPDMQDDLKLSFSDSAAQDRLIEAIVGTVMTNTVELADETQLKKLLASQQSKRSRAKGKEMTVANYLSMMSAAIAEQVIRTVMNKPRGTSVVAGSSTMPLTEQDIVAYQSDLEAANKKIRSLQSWKSTHKIEQGTANWTVVCESIAALQALRPASSSIKVVKEDARISALREKLAGQDLSKMKSADKEALLQDILAQLAQ